MTQAIAPGFPPGAPCTYEPWTPDWICEVVE
jgi:hypothetical protein